jgi:Kef-type K+ transport system membrane component KefB
MGAAALNDAVAWCLLILAISIANAGNLATAAYVFLAVCCFALGLFFLIAPLFSRLVQYVEALEDPSHRGNLFALTLVIMFLCAWTTELLGVHSIFG